MQFKAQINLQLNKKQKFLIQLKKSSSKLKIIKKLVNMNKNSLNCSLHRDPQ